MEASPSIERGVGLHVIVEHLGGREMLIAAKVLNNGVDGADSRYVQAKLFFERQILEDLVITHGGAGLVGVNGLGDDLGQIHLVLLISVGGSCRRRARGTLIHSISTVEPMQ